MPTEGQSQEGPNSVTIIDSQLPIFHDLAAQGHGSEHGKCYFASVIRCPKYCSRSRSFYNTYHHQPSTMSPFCP